MENPLKGDTRLVVKAGTPAEKTYVLRFSINSLCIAEEILKMGIEEIIIRVSTFKPTMLMTRALLFCACAENHKDEISTLEAAGDMIEQAGFMRAAGAISIAIAVSLPDQEGKSGKDKKKPDPAKK